MLFTKCILDKIEPSDGIRISVMSRHTLKDGKTRDSRLNCRYNEWIKGLAPPSKLVGDYYKRGLPWEEYEKRYLEFLRTSYTADNVQKLANRAMIKNITIMCIEETPEFCHRRILAEECKRYEPDLHVKHK